MLVRSFVQTSAFGLKLVLLGTLNGMSTPSALAQIGAASDTEEAPDEIVVTARRREETSIAVPVVLTAVGAEEIERRAINSIDGLARVVPQLISGEGGGTIQGGNITLRGIGAGESNPFQDQAVSFNIDGVQVAKASIRRLAGMDMAQIEVLKGPQALFFGKNSPGGIISIRTADPTSSFEVKGSAGYEFEADEIRSEGHVSGPISSTLGARLAYYVSDMKGWMDNATPRTEFLAPKDRRVPNQTEYALRGTVKFEPDDRFDARLKLGFSRRTGSGPGANTQVTLCPLGFPQRGGLEDCKKDRVTYHGDLGPNFGRFEPIFGDGAPFLKMSQILGSLEMNYDLTDSLSLTSVTGFYRLRQTNAENFVANYNAAFALASANPYRNREITQELRLASDYEGPLNFLVGVHYQDSKAQTNTVSMNNALTPVVSNKYHLEQEGKAWSVFGQVMIEPVPTLEISVGARHSHEKKRLPIVRQGVVPFGTPIPVREPVHDRGRWTNLSPEATITWRPTGRFTAFGSYKEGFLSGGFNSGATNFNASLRYDQQLIKGFEGGVKALLFDGSLRANLSAYRYVITGLQVTTSVQPNTSVLQAIQIVTNAGKVTIKGIEADATYRVPFIDGLQLRGAVSYNRARYNEYFAPCYRGQTVALGCNLPPLSGTLFTRTDLAGAQVVRAPEWTGNVGFNYERDIGSNLRMGLSADLGFSSGYFTDASNNPLGRQKGYETVDAAINIGDQDDRWNVALIGRNITNTFYNVRTSTSVGTGSAAGGVTGFVGDISGTISRTREVLLRLTLKYGG